LRRRPPVSRLRSGMRAQQVRRSSVGRAPLEQAHNEAEQGNKRTHSNGLRPVSRLKTFSRLPGDWSEHRRCIDTQGYRRPRRPGTGAGGAAPRRSGVSGSPMAIATTARTRPTASFAAARPHRWRVGAMYGAGLQTATPRSDVTGLLVPRPRASPRSGALRPSACFFTASRLRHGLGLPA
jgi:hypothetical protein